MVIYIVYIHVRKITKTQSLMKNLEKENVGILLFPINLKSVYSIFKYFTI